MQVLAPRCLLIQSTADFPNFIGATNVILDFETSSGRADEKSVNPWRHCGPLGFSITVDDCSDAYYFDWMRADTVTQNFARKWLQDVLTYAQSWINHHVKYDAHVATNYHGIIVPDHLELVCTIVQSKLLDSDRVTRGGYGLDVLCRDWLGHDISKYEARLQPYLVKNKDYGKIPTDIIGEYACVDVLEDRELYQYIQKRLPARCANVSKTEIGVTRELFKCEQHGMRFDPTTLRLAQFETFNRVCQLDDELTNTVGRPINVKSADDCANLLVGQYGLPIVKYTKDSEGEETDNASFDKHALKAYEAMPFAPKEVIRNIIEQRKLLQLNSLYFVPWLEMAPDGTLHPEYNQVVRTGRMSCSQPNAQQLNSFIKGLIIPRPGYSIVSTDASQIEFRLIVHYIQDQNAIAKFAANADEDFHQLVADLCGIARKPAKTINFGTAFGEGKKKLIGQIGSDPDIRDAVEAEVKALKLRNAHEEVVEANRRIVARGEAIYDAYHAMLPTLKPTSKTAESYCKSLDRRTLLPDGKHAYGYITNLFGRDRHLPYCLYRTDYKTKDPLDKAWLAFPTLNQSSAADLMKEALVELMSALYGADIHLLAVVHDEIVLEVPNEIANDYRFRRDLVGITEHPRISLDVPIRWSVGVSPENWCDASTSVRDGGKSDVVQYRREECSRFGWLWAGGGAV